MIRVTKKQVAELLRAVADEVESGDSMEGNITWLLPQEDDAKPGELDLDAKWRVGNLDGQGGMVIL